ncbi:MAG: hypothetical protein Q4E73_09200 [Lachnospiraceae bacterium]|nr:hypothetical protein [Lachnospiraceae bacterium]
MMAQTREEQLKEIKYQTKMLDNLKKWIWMFMLLSSIGMVFAYWALNLHNGSIFNLIGFVSIVIAVLSVVGCIIIGLGYKKGRANVDKILRVVEDYK